MFRWHAGDNKHYGSTAYLHLSRSLTSAPRATNLAPCDVQARWEPSLSIEYVLRAMHANACVCTLYGEDEEEERFLPNLYLFYLDLIQDLPYVSQLTFVTARKISVPQTLWCTRSSQLARLQSSFCKAERVANHLASPGPNAASMSQAALLGQHIHINSAPRCLRNPFRPGSVSGRLPASSRASCEIHTQKAFHGQTQVSFKNRHHI